MVGEIYQSNLETHRKDKLRHPSPVLGCASPLHFKSDNLAIEMTDYTWKRIRQGEQSRLWQRKHLTSLTSIPTPFLKYTSSR